MREGRDGIDAEPEELEAHERELDRRLLSVICRSTGRRRTADERRHVDELVREIRCVREARHEAARHP